MGGLDACYGRWDTHNHPLADVHPTEFYKSLFPGQGESGHSNAVLQWAEDQTTTIRELWISRLSRSLPRMRWPYRMLRGCVSTSLSISWDKLIIQHGMIHP